MREIVIDDKVLNEIVRRLVEAVDPDRIILFGSRARGDARPDSDIDLLIIKDTDQPGYRRAIRISRAYWNGHPQGHYLEDSRGSARLVSSADLHHHSRAERGKDAL